PTRAADNRDPALGRLQPHGAGTPDPALELQEQGVHGVVDRAAKRSERAASEDPRVERGARRVPVLDADALPGKAGASFDHRREPHDDAAAPDLPIALNDHELLRSQDEPGFAAGARPRRPEPDPDPDPVIGGSGGP